MLSIMTCGDANYFRFLKIFEENIYQTYASYPIIYDLGMTQNQRAGLRSAIFHTYTDDKFFKKNPKNCIYATHKPYCILHFLCNQINDCIYMDADTLSTAKIQENIFSKFDIAITPRHNKENKQSHLKNGLLNSGFIFFKNTPPVKSFVEEWLQACVKSECSDQEALSQLLSREVDLLNGPATQKFGELSVGLLDPSEFNDVSCSTGRILHFKNAARKKKALQQYLNTAATLKKYPLYVFWKTTLTRIFLRTISFILGNQKKFLQNSAQIKFL